MTRNDDDTKALADAVKAGITIEDIARAWASIDGKRDEFDEGKGISAFKDRTGHYAGYMIEAREMIDRAAKYAMERSAAA